MNKHVKLPIGEIEVIAATRLALGIGIGLLGGHFLSERQRRLIGWTLAIIGVVSSPPLIYDVYRQKPQ